MSPRLSALARQGIAKLAGCQPTALPDDLCEYAMTREGPWVGVPNNDLWRMPYVRCARCGLVRAGARQRKTIEADYCALHGWPCPE